MKNVTGCFIINAFARETRLVKRKLPDLVNSTTPPELTTNMNTWEYSQQKRPKYSPTQFQQSIYVTQSCLNCCIP